MGVDTQHEGSSAVGEAGRGETFRARVNGRLLTLDPSSGQIVKGPAGIRGQYIAPAQLERIKGSDGYYGHLFLATKPEHRRLTEAEFLLMEHKANKGRVTLTEGMSIIYNGMSGCRIEQLTESVAIVSMGGVTRKVSRDRLEREAAPDYEEMSSGSVLVENEDIEWASDEPGEPKAPKTFGGEVEIDTDDLAKKVSEKMLESAFVDAVAARVVEMLGSTPANVGEQPTGAEDMQ